MTATNNTAARNSTASVDFNNEVKGIMSETNTTEGREIKLAVAIYYAQEKFNIAHLMGGAANKADAQRKALAANSPAFADKVSKYADLKKELKKASLSRATTIQFEMKDIDRSIRSATAMLNRALVSAYWLKMSNASVGKLDGTSLTVEYDGQTDGKAARIKERVTRADMHKFGSAVASERGIVKKKEAAGNGSKPVPFKETLKKANTVTDTVKLVAESVEGMKANERDELISHKSFAPSLASLIRAQFAHEGVIELSDIAEFLRDNLNGVRIETGNAPRKPDARKAS